MKRFSLIFLLWYICVLCVQPQNRFLFLYPYHIADLCVMGAVGFHLLGVMTQGGSFVRVGSATALSMVLLAQMLASLFLGPMQDQWYWSEYANFVFKGIVLLVLVESICDTVPRLWAVQAALLLSTLWWVKAGLRLSSAGAMYAGGRIMGPAVGMVENPNGFAYMMSVMIPIQLYFYQQADTKIMKALFLTLAAASVYIVLKTQSRTGFLILLIVGAFLLPKYGARHKTAVVVGGVAFFLLLTFVGGVSMSRFKSIPDSMLSFLTGEEAPAETLSQDEQSAQERRMKNRDTWALIKSYPVFGAGISANEGLFVDEFPNAAGQVHNELLMTGRLMGVPGMVIYAVMLGTLFRNGRRIQRRCAGWWPAVSDLGWTLKIQAIVFVVGGMFSPLPFSVFMMILVGCGSALWSMVRAIPVPASAARPADTALAAQPGMAGA